MLGVKQQKLLIENKPLKAWIKKEQQRRNGQFNDEIVQKPPISHDFDGVKNTNEKELFDGKIPEGNFYDEYADDALERILTNQRHIIKALKKHGQPKYLADR